MNISSTYLHFLWHFRIDYYGEKASMATEWHKSPLWQRGVGGDFLVIISHSDFTYQGCSYYNVFLKLIMNKFTNKFVFSKQNIRITDVISIEKDDVGVIKSELKEGASIFFIRIWQEVTLNKNDFEIFDGKKTGDGFPKKICNICHKLLNTTEFERNQNGKNNRPVRRPSCQKCRKQLEGTNATPKEKLKWLNTKPQNEPFECPICAKRTIAGITSKVVLDHNHRSGEVRGWVCDSCNTGIGRFKDDVDLIKRAIKYLE